MIASLLALLVVGFVVVVAAMVLIALFSAILSIVVGIVGFLLFKVAPVVVLCWLAVKAIQRWQQPKGMSASDTAWLDR